MRRDKQPLAGGVAGVDARIDGMAHLFGQNLLGLLVVVEGLCRIAGPHHEPDAHLAQLRVERGAGKATAENGARAAYKKIKRGAAEFKLTLAQGRPDLYPETPVQVAGFKADIDGEKLSDDAWHRRFEIGPGSLHDTLTHIVGAMFRWADRIDGTWVFNPGRQIGPVPAHIEIDLAARTATWRSLITATSSTLHGSLTVTVTRR